MHNSGKALLSALIAVGLGTFTVPAGRALATSNEAAINSRGVAYQQYAQEEHHYVVEKTDRKVDELHDMGTGAAHAVRRVHRKHEADEYKHHGLRDKTKAKIEEVHDQVVGAKSAIVERHEQHERAEDRK